MFGVNDGKIHLKLLLKKLCAILTELLGFLNSCNPFIGCTIPKALLYIINIIPDQCRAAYIRVQLHHTELETILNGQWISKQGIRKQSYLCSCSPSVSDANVTPPIFIY